MMRDPLGQPARVHKHERCPVRSYQLGHSIIDIRPNGVGDNRAQLVLGDFDPDIHPPLVTDVDDRRKRTVSGQKSRHQFDGTLRG
jgi:hypothetical protein